MMTGSILRGDRTPVGAVLRIGRKNPQKGHPELNDRFFIVSRHESEATFGTRKGTMRLPLQEFASFNERTEKDPITVIRGELVCARRADNWTYSRRAQQLPGEQWPNHPNRRPACSSEDGVKATRYYGIGEEVPNGVSETDREDWREIECPGRQCEFSQEWGKAKVRPCKVFGRLYFVPRWSKDNLPSPLMMYATRSWASAENIESFFSYVEARARELSVERFSFCGVPFILTLTRKTQPKSARVFPVGDMTIDGEPTNAFANARAQIESAGGHVPLMIGTSEAETEPGVVDADFEDVSAPGVPGATLFEDQ